jgi:hypothetical protein
MASFRDHFRFANAIENHHIETLREMLAQGYDVNSASDYGESAIETAMPRAIAKGDATVLRLLWEAGAKVAEDSFGAKIFQEFASGRDPAALLTKERKAQAKAKKKKEAEEPLVEYRDSDSPCWKFDKAILFHDLKMIDKMLAEGYEVNDAETGLCPHVEGAIPYASYEADPTFLKILWQSGAKVPPNCFAADVFAEFEAGRDGLDVLDPDGEIRARKAPRKGLRELADNFSVKKLKAGVGTLRLAEDASAIEIPIEPFKLDGEQIATSIRLDDVSLPDQPEALEGKTFRFPINPEDGYIDGSIYLRNEHNPVDVTQIKFGTRAEDLLPATVSMQFNFDCIGFDNESRRWKVTLRVEHDKS